MTNDQDATIYHEVPGGTEFLRWFGQAPNFHDAEILSLDLRRKGQSTLCLHSWIPKFGASQDGVSVLDRHAVVTFSLEGVMDVQLDGFNAQNVIDGLILRRAPDRPERRSYLVLDPLRQDIEIELEPCYGLHGLIRARSVFITFQPGSPNARDI